MDAQAPIVIVSRSNALPNFTLAQLREKTAWIRDGLEPGIAREGPRVLEADTVLDLNEFFTRLRIFNISYDTIQQSRIHRAILLVSGRGTRWPKKLVDTCDVIVEEWTERFGKLETIWPILYGPGGRLHGIGEPKGLSRHAVIMKWMSDPASLVSPLRALEHGHLEFHPGQWWIHPLFAFRDGIIDSPDSHGGITVDHDGVYAITLTGYDEVDGETFGVITYRCRTRDRSKCRLLRAFLPPKQPLRILRSHTLHSIWSPVAGVRYDGLYHIAGYSWKYVKGEPTLDVKLERQLGQISMATVLSHPTADEIEDYVEYKRLRDIRQHKKRETPEHAHHVLPEPPPELLGFNAIDYSEERARSLKTKRKLKHKSPPRPALRDAYASSETIMQISAVNRGKERADPFHAKLLPSSELNSSDEDEFKLSATDLRSVQTEHSESAGASTSTLMPASSKTESSVNFVDGPGDDFLMDSASHLKMLQENPNQRRDSGVSFQEDTSKDQDLSPLTRNFDGLAVYNGNTPQYSTDESVMDEGIPAADISKLAMNGEHLYDQIAFRGEATGETMHSLAYINYHLNIVNDSDPKNVSQGLLEELERLKTTIEVAEDLDGGLPCSADGATLYLIGKRDSMNEFRYRKMSMQYRRSNTSVESERLERSWESPFAGFAA